MREREREGEREREREREREIILNTSVLSTYGCNTSAIKQH